LPSGTILNDLKKKDDTELVLDYKEVPIGEEATRWKDEALRMKEKKTYYKNLAKKYAPQALNFSESSNSSPKSTSLASSTN
jgi:hypothetical protein